MLERPMSGPVAAVGFVGKTGERGSVWAGQQGRLGNRDTERE